MQDFGLFTKRELCHMLRINTITKNIIKNHPMRSLMATRKRILRTKARMTQLIQWFKITELELMLDFGLCLKRELTNNTDIESHLMRLLMVTRKKTLRTKMKMIQTIKSSKTTGLVPMLDSGPSIKDLLQEATTTTFNSKLTDLLMR
jgi:hypothetical protein